MPSFREARDLLVSELPDRALLLVRLNDPSKTMFSKPSQYFADNLPILGPGFLASAGYLHSCADFWQIEQDGRLRSLPWQVSSVANRGRALAPGARMLTI